MSLRPGAFQFGPASLGPSTDGDEVPVQVSFELDIERRDFITVRKGSEALAVEGVSVVDPVSAFPGDVIQLASDHFSVQSDSWPAEPTPPDHVVVEPVAGVPAPRRRALWPIWILLIGAGAALAEPDLRFLALTALGAFGLVADVMIRARRHRRAEQARRSAIEAASRRLGHDLQRLRTAVARELRSEHPGPATITELANDEADWPPSRGGRELAVAIASGDVTWDPPLAGRGDTGWPHHQVVAKYDFLPAVPFTFDLFEGPIAIVGPRAAALAIGRHLLTSTMTQFHPVAVHTQIFADAPRVGDWECVAAAPHLMHDDALFGDRPDLAADRSLVRLFDGVDPDEVASSTESADILLLSPLDPVPDDVSLVFEVAANGTATATRPGEPTATGLTPHGIGADHARELVRSLVRRSTEPPRDIVVPDVIDLRDEVTVTDPESSTMTTIDLDTPDEPIGLSTTSTPEPVRRPHPPLELVTSEDDLGANATVAQAAFDLAAEQREMQILILDRGDRRLIRLAQLPQCRRYAAVDDLRSVERLIVTAERALERPLETEDADRLLVLLLADISGFIAFLRRSDRRDLEKRVIALVGSGDSRLRVATSARPGSSLPSSLAGVFTRATNEISELPPIDVSRIPTSAAQASGHDLTGAVAALKRAARSATSSTNA